jgi:hypothetical protein
MNPALALFGLPPSEAAAIGTLALAAVAVVSLLVSYRLFKISRAQTEESRGQNTATLRLAMEQLELNRLQLAAITEQAEIAQRALSLQVTPRLIPAGGGAARIGPSEPIWREPQHLEVTPTFLGLVNAGNGVAVFDVDRAEATCGPDGGKGGMGIIVPPALAGGAEGQIKLTPGAGRGAQAVQVGIIYNVSIPYRGSDPNSLRRILRFTAQYFSERHWEIKIVHSDD